VAEIKRVALKAGCLDTQEDGGKPTSFVCNQCGKVCLSPHCVSHSECCFVYSFSKASWRANTIWTTRLARVTSGRTECSMLPLSSGTLDHKDKFRNESSAG
jgi:hypothetical protein